ncbi:hypothetical protein M8998_03870 [Sphingobacterium sp. lm-10]|uniref:hypothetical protein n=1 Tax=Sphingobacterium sp. lm-10 TaxID=2944904 RepID=UPI0020221A10|nr:hypothetical protein [Sphingobacterium sp. lm-10]MCL7987076.1 hypothetical protein [Sphingobacterium sp. lm-10]
MKYFIVVVFILSLLGVCFLCLNYLWAWFPVDYGQVMKIILSGLILLLVLTGLAMLFSSALGENPNHPSVGKK